MIKLRERAKGRPEPRALRIAGQKYSAPQARDF
jgi:hypothetical protein